MAVVFTDKNKCKGCYACIRICPANAIKVEEGLAEVMKERCIACGNCVRICSQKAKQIESDIGIMRVLLSKYRAPIACLDYSFPVAFPEIRPGQLVTALLELGFSEVVEGAFGAELIIQEYQKLINTNKQKTILSSQCPAVVSYIEKYYPQLIDNLAPIVTPMIAMGRLIKKHHHPEAKVIFISPCIAKRAERDDEKVGGVIDAVLTFNELKELLTGKAIDPTSLAKTLFFGPKPNLGRLCAIPGGFSKAIGISCDLLGEEVVVGEGTERVLEIIHEIDKGDIKVSFVELFMCEGCISGPSISSELSYFKKKQIVTEYALKEAAPLQTEKDLAKYGDMNLRRRFTNRYTSLPYPTEEEIRGVLSLTDKTKPEDELNCGACGYKTCREKAIAVYRGLAENEMCWPYVVKRLKATQEQLIQAEKLTSLGQLAAAIAHELNNPLAGVLVYARLLSKKLGSDGLPKEEALSYLSKIEAEVSRSSGIIRNLLDFARQSEPRLRVVDVNQVIDQALSLVSHQAQLQNVEIVKEFRCDGCFVMADLDQLRQVFTNLILNAIQAMSQGGKLTLQTEIISEEGPGGEKQEWVKVDIADTGCGISKENMRRLFTPFFTTKERGKGVGLGLAVVHGIVQRHKGKIKVNSEVDKGTTFTIYLEAYHEGSN